MRLLSCFRRADASSQKNSSDEEQQSPVAPLAPASQSAAPGAVSSVRSVLPAEIPLKPASPDSSSHLLDLLLASPVLASHDAQGTGHDYLSRALKQLTVCSELLRASIRLYLATEELGTGGFVFVACTDGSTVEPRQRPPGLAEAEGLLPRLTTSSGRAPVFLPDPPSASTTANAGGARGPGGGYNPSGSSRCGSATCAAAVPLVSGGELFGALLVQPLPTPHLRDGDKSSVDSATFSGSGPPAVATPSPPDTPTTAPDLRARARELRQLSGALSLTLGGDRPALRALALSLLRLSAGDSLRAVAAELCAALSQHVRWRFLASPVVKAALTAEEEATTAFLFDFPRGRSAPLPRPPSSALPPAPLQPAPAPPPQHPTQSAHGQLVQGTPASQLPRPVSGPMLGDGHGPGPGPGDTSAAGPGARARVGRQVATESGHGSPLGPVDPLLLGTATQAVSLRPYSQEALAMRGSTSGFSVAVSGSWEPLGMRPSTQHSSSNLSEAVPLGAAHVAACEAAGTLVARPFPLSYSLLMRVLMQRPRPYGIAVADCHRMVQDVHQPSRDVCMLMTCAAASPPPHSLARPSLGHGGGGCGGGAAHGGAGYGGGGGAGWPTSGSSLTIPEDFFSTHSPVVQPQPGPAGPNAGRRGSIVTAFAGTVSARGHLPGAAGGGGGGGVAGGLSVQSLALVAAHVGGGVTLAFYCCFSARLPGQMVEAVRCSCQRLLDDVLAPAVAPKLKEELAAELAALRLGVPGIFAILPRQAPEAAASAAGSAPGEAPGIFTVPSTQSVAAHINASSTADSSPQPTGPALAFTTPDGPSATTSTAGGPNLVSSAASACVSGAQAPGRTSDPFANSGPIGSGAGEALSLSGSAPIGAGHVPSFSHQLRQLPQAQRAPGHVIIQAAAPAGPTDPMSDGTPGFAASAPLPRPHLDFGRLGGQHAARPDGALLEIQPQAQAQAQIQIQPQQNTCQRDSRGHRHAQAQHGAAVATAPAHAVPGPTRPHVAQTLAMYAPGMDHLPHPHHPHPHSAASGQTGYARHSHGASPLSQRRPNPLSPQPSVQPHHPPLQHPYQPPPFSPPYGSHQSHSQPLFQGQMLGLAKQPSGAASATFASLAVAGAPSAASTSGHASTITLGGSAVAISRTTHNGTIGGGAGGGGAAGGGGGGTDGKLSGSIPLAVLTVCDFPSGAKSERLQLDALVAGVRDSIAAAAAQAANEAAAAAADEAAAEAAAAVAALGGLAAAGVQVAPASAEGAAVLAASESRQGLGRASMATASSSSLAGGRSTAACSGPAGLSAALADAAAAAAAATDLAADADVADLRLVAKLGHGGGGCVYLGRMGGGLEVAVKLLEMSGGDVNLAELVDFDSREGLGGSRLHEGMLGLLAQQAARQQLRARRSLLRSATELAMLTSVSHPHVIQVYGTYSNVVLEPEVSAGGGRTYRLRHRSAFSDDDPTGLEPGRALPGAGCAPVCCAVLMTLCEMGSLASALASGAFPHRVGPSPAAPAGPTSLLAAASSAPPDVDSPAFATAVLQNLKAVYLTLLEIALALRYLHGRHIVHRDLKPGNVLLKGTTATASDPRGFTAKLADFGLAAVLDCQPQPPTEPGLDDYSGPSGGVSGGVSGGISGSAHSPFSASRGNSGLSVSPSGGRGPLVEGDWSTARYTLQDEACGTVDHMAPEATKGNGARITAAIDIYAFGILMLEAVTAGRRPYGPVQADRITRLVVAGTRPIFPAWVPDAYRSLAEHCWAAHPSHRPTAAQLVILLRQHLQGLAGGSGSGAVGAGGSSGGALPGAASSMLRKSRLQG
ncbi:hypothetical protein HYH03_002816 [Edaphochlamys debaryana]|uniref:Protein kinase domain-containing protein n=1 Tax=Edaphochlamys debaryana TaxID=47281 RepID=A0A835YCU0_9CHLO|nr:hypothetical protein HYH03_002816 [Edaphochlamys debaryana]|eukprot:KAG2499237.1 hypothetical protein HYH03_002816 [Edaphochlamys debaryana]